MIMEVVYSGKGVVSGSLVCYGIFRRYFIPICTPSHLEAVVGEGAQGAGWADVEGDFEKGTQIRLKICPNPSTIHFPNQQASSRECSSHPSRSQPSPAIQSLIPFLSRQIR